MKKILLSLLIGCSLCAMAQEDRAVAIVDRYLRLLNYEAIPADSLLVIETTITFLGQTDTIHMQRLYQTGGMMRVDIYSEGAIRTGICTNGTTRYRRYMPAMGWWDSRPSKEVLEAMEPYDFRGPLYHWRQDSTHLSYRGTAEMDGHQLEVVQAERPDRYTRLYFFDPQSGLLNLIVEKNEIPIATRKHIVMPDPIDYKFLHEYSHVGASLVPTEESYRRAGELTIMRSRAYFEARNDILFNQD